MISVSPDSNVIELRQALRETLLERRELRRENRGLRGLWRAKFRRLPPQLQELFEVADEIAAVTVCGQSAQWDSDGNCQPCGECADCRLRNAVQHVREAYA